MEYTHPKLEVYGPLDVFNQAFQYPQHGTALKAKVQLLSKTGKYIGKSHLRKIQIGI